jgi:hypothetical protein
MKKYIICLVIAFSLIESAAACSMCRKLENAWESFTTSLEKKACENAQFHYKRITGKDGFCEHGGKHKANY